MARTLASKAAHAVGLAAMGVLVFSLGACDWFDKKKDPLPGERISVLVHSRSLKPDPGAATDIVLPAPAPNRDWPQAGGYPSHAMHHLLVNDQLKRAWKTDIGSGASDYERLVGSPVIAGGRIFAADAENRISAYDVKDGSRVWREDVTPKREDSGHIVGGLAFYRDRIYVSAGFAQVIALDAKTGKEVWRQPIPGPMRTAPTAHGGRIFVVTVDNQVFALDSETGKALWTYAGIAETASILGGGSPAIDGGVLVVPFSSGELVALRVENGRLLWSDSLATARRTDQVSTLSHIRGRPIIDRGRVFAMSHGGIMVSIDLRSGRRVWDREIGGLESPWVAGDYLFALTSEAEIVCLNRADGRILWVQELPRFSDEKKKKGPIVWTGPILASDRLIVGGSHGQALAVSPYSGQIIGREEMPDGVAVAPVVADGSVYFLANDADLVAYR